MSQVSPPTGAALRRAHPDARLSLPGEPAYAAATDIWAGGTDRQPAAVHACRTAAEVRAALRLAREHGLAVAVRGGGHDWARRALCEGLVIDLREMRAVTPATDGRTIRIEGGALAADVFAAADPLGAAVVTGASGKVGMAGLTLGGGYGALIGRFGLALDNLVSAEVVMADGTLLHASASSEPELFWALRGGGGNFGVVVAMEHRLHALDTVYSGPMFWPFEAAHAVLAHYAALAAELPDALTVQLGLLVGPEGAPMLLAAPTWSGVPEEGPARVAPLCRAAAPLLAQLAHQPYGASNTLFDARVVNGRRVCMDTRSLPALTPAAIGILLDAFARRPSDACAILTHEFRGAAARIAPDATAFAMREPHLLVEIIAVWPGDDPDDAARHLQWVATLSAALAAHALPGGYPNLLPPGDPARAAASFGINAARVAAAKRHYDPANVFASALPLPSGTSTPARPNSAPRTPGRTTS
ncbi:FAD-binding oxidoreductase [Burkholderia gladioli]|uniref:FAD-binding oxidoreductase n=1 Tax=Burkholderia gladioli TaxID=28095 RepID=UPI00163FFFE9|nr:FAD-binding protein [Burkholderia gladioli]